MYGHAITSSVVANANRKKGRKAFRPLDFMPKEKEMPTAKAFIANLKAILTVNRSSKEREKNGNNRSPAPRNPRA